MQSVDVVIVGAGMAGGSAAYFLAPHVRVLLLERESQPGYHATGRSAAMYSETYGNATVRAITTASKAFYFKPPPGFAEHPLVTPRGSLIVGAGRHPATRAGAAARGGALGCVRARRDGHGRTRHPPGFSARR